jgi:hypothetical protein
MQCLTAEIRSLHRSRARKAGNNTTPASALLIPLLNVEVEEVEEERRGTSVASDRCTYGSTRNLCMDTADVEVDVDVEFAPTSAVDLPST